MDLEVGHKNVGQIRTVQFRVKCGYLAFFLKQGIAEKNF